MDRRFIGECIKRCGVEADSHTCHLFDIDTVRLLGKIELKGLDAVFKVGQRDMDTPVKAPCAKQCLIKYIDLVGCTDHDDPGALFKAIHFGQQLIECRFTFIVAKLPSAFAHRIDLIDKDNTGSILFCFAKELADTLGTHTNIDMHKTRPALVKKRYTRLPRDRFGDKGLAYTRRPDEEYPFGQTYIELSVLLRFTQKIDDLLKLLFDIFDSCNIIESNVGFDRHDRLYPLIITAS